MPNTFDGQRYGSDLDDLEYIFYIKEFGNIW